MYKKTTTNEYFTSACPNTRIRNALAGGGIKTMAQLCAMTEEQLMRVRNFGLKSLDIVLVERKKFLAGGS